jgi:hypothetical protein
MLVEPTQENMLLAKSLRAAHGLYDDHEDVATSRFIRQFLVETDKRA